jgi:hypothetical protein
MAHFSLDLNKMIPIKYIPLVLRCLLDRIPILIYGQNPEEIDNFSSNLIKFIPNRQELIFWSDFVSLDEYNSILEKEEQDLESARTVVRVPSLASKQAFNNFKFFKSWIITATSDVGKIEDIVKIALENNNKILVIDLTDPIKINLMGGNSDLSLDLGFEKMIIDNIINRSEDSLEKIRRVLKKKIFGSTLSTLLTTNLLNFGGEKNSLEESIFNSEILSFVNASKRALLLLTRLNLIKEFKIDASISEKTLLDSIQYDRAGAHRILDFIKAEWGQNFSHFVKKGKFSVFGDIIDGLWG